jgi:truncated hemoglobin YjbI
MSVPGLVGRRSAASLRHPELGRGTPAQRSPEAGWSVAAAATPITVTVLEFSAHAAVLGARIGSVGSLRRVTDRFYVRVLGDDNLAPFFGAESGVVKWHQMAQLSSVLGGPDLYLAAGLPQAYMYAPVELPAVLYRRAAALLIQALDAEGPSWEAVSVVATALSARACLVVGGVRKVGALRPVEGVSW